MPSPAPLLIASRAEATVPAPDLPLQPRPAPPLAASATEKTLLLAAAATFALHAAVLAWMAFVPGDESGRSAGIGADLILLEGIPVEIVQAAPTPEAPPSEASPAIEPPPEEPPPDAAPAEDVPPPEEQAPPEAESDALPARPDEPPPATEPPPEEPPPPAEAPPPEARPPEAAAEPDAPPPDPAAVPTPRARPERTVVAVAEPTDRKPPKPSAPAPSAPAAPSAPTRSGGAGGGGAAQTAGTAAESAYRAKVAARLAAKKFYPSAARRDRPTGRATVRFTLNASGRVTAVKVVRSTGARVLDDAAVEMVRRGAPYPPIPRGLGSTITIQAPIDFAAPR